MQVSKYRQTNPTTTLPLDSSRDGSEGMRSGHGKMRLHLNKIRSKIFFFKQLILIVSLSDH